LRQQSNGPNHTFFYRGEKHMADTNPIIRSIRLPNGRHRMTPEYAAYNAMKSRCNNPKHHAYARYGGRGIRICDRWLESFENFFADMGFRPSTKHSLDRKNNDGNYSPENCRWATDLEQTNNQSTNHLLTFEGKTQTITQWAREAGLDESVLRMRISGGWSVQRALTTPKFDSPIAGLAREHGVAETTLHRRLKRGISLKESLDLIPRPGKFRLTDAEVAEIRRLRGEGLTLQVIANKFGTCTSHVYRLINNQRRA
jgi:hypothetical protein